MTHLSIRVLLALLLAATWAATAAARPQAEREQERRALEVVDAVGSGDAERTHAALESHFHPDLWERRSADDWRRMAAMLSARHAGIEVSGVEITEPQRLTVATAAPTGPSLRFQFDFESFPPYRITGLGLELGRPGAGREEEALPPPELPEGATESEIAARLDGWFADLARRGLFSGTALVAWEGGAVFRGAYGLASRRWQVPNRIDTRFDLGSINKVFTKVAVAQLMAAGKLSLDDTLAVHLPDYPDPAVAAKVTLRHLVDHTSGLGDIFTEEYRRTSKDLLRTPRDFFPLFASEPLRFEPGTGEEYSNAGYMVLGAVIEEASGMPYDRYVKERIFQPAGMAASGFFARDEPVPNVATGYTRWSEEGAGPGETLRDNVYRLPVRGNSAGSAQSTVDDLLGFENALREHRLLPPAYTAWVLNGPEPAPGGGAEAAQRATTPIGIAGGGPGVSALLESDGSLTLVLLANQDPGLGPRVRRALAGPLTAALRR